MCESEAHCLAVSGGSPGVERLNVPSPGEEEAASENPIDSLVTRDSQDGSQHDPATEKVPSDVFSESDVNSRLDVGSGEAKDPLGLTTSTSKESLSRESDEIEGVDPFSDKPNKLNDRRGSKTVNFKEPEVEESPTQNGSFSASSKGGIFLEEEDAKTEKHINKQWTLGEGNPVYRLSLKLSPNLFNMTEIPGANQHREAEKAGYLTKLSGRTFPYIPQWKRRYCVLAKGSLFYYEREDSKPGEKANGVINLAYFDHVAEAGPKDCKKATNVFVITSQDRSFFDPGRHLFSAESLPDMKDWIKKLHSALEQIRNNNRPATSTSSSTKESGKRRKEEKRESKDKGQNKENQHGSIREKKKKKTEESNRSRKPGVSSETQTTSVESASVTSGQEADQQAMTSPKGGVQLPGLTVHKGIQLPGLSARKEVQDAEEAKSSEVNEEGLPVAGPTLPCVTKLRVKGPQGRRAPQNHRRTLAATALKKRASSLSALEYQDLNDNRSESSQGQRGSSRESQTPENVEESDISEVEEGSDVRQVQFDDIENDLFFKPREREGGREGDENGEQVKTEIKKEKRRSSTLKVNFHDTEHRRSTSRSRNGTIIRSQLTRLRETVVSIKRNRFESKDPIGNDHPDMMDNPRWTCGIL